MGRIIIEFTFHGDARKVEATVEDVVSGDLIRGAHALIADFLGEIEEAVAAGRLPDDLPVIAQLLQIERQLFGICGGYTPGGSPVRFSVGTA